MVYHGAGNRCFPGYNKAHQADLNQGCFGLRLAHLTPTGFPSSCNLIKPKKECGATQSNETQNKQWEPVWARENNLTPFFCAVHSRVQTGMGFFQHASSFKEIHTMWSYLVVRFFKKKSLHHMWHSKPGFLLLLCQFCPCFCKSASCEWTPAQHDTSSLSSYISQPIDLRHAIVFLCVCVCAVVFNLPYHFIA